MKLVKYPKTFSLMLLMGALLALVSMLSYQPVAADGDFQVIVDGKPMQLDELTLEINHEPAEIAQIVELVGDGEVQAERIVRIVNEEEIVLREATAVLSATRLQVDGIGAVSVRNKTSCIICIMIILPDGTVITICFHCCCSGGGDSPTPTPTPTPESCQTGITRNGTWGNDVLYGAQNNDVINGRPGKDHIYGEDCNDILYGGGGKDKIYGGDGDDIIYGGGNNDIIDGGPGYDQCYGQGGRKDTFVNCEVAIQ